MILLILSWLGWVISIFMLCDVFIARRRLEKKQELFLKYMEVSYNAFKEIYGNFGKADDALILILNHLKLRYVKAETKNNPAKLMPLEDSND